MKMKTKTKTEPEPIVIPRGRIERAMPFAHLSFWDAFAAEVPTSGLVLDWCSVAKIARRARIVRMDDTVLAWIPGWLHRRLQRYMDHRPPTGGLNQWKRQKRMLELLYFWLTKTTPRVR